MSPGPRDRAPGWPTVSWEDVSWTSSLPVDLLSRSVRARMAESYRAAVTPVVAELDVLLPRGVVAEAEHASDVVRAFDAEVGGDVAPFTAILLRSESASSSQIENLTSGARQIALAELGEVARHNAELVVGNVAAMRAAVALSDTTSADTILAIHRALLERSAPEIAGRWRTDQVWIGGDGYSPHGATFVPPVAARVPGAIDDLVAFARRQDVPALTHAAVAHAQLETIHPFADGNGRTGRAFVHAMLRARGLTRSATVPVSAGLLVDVDGYFRALTEYRSGDLAPIVTAFSAAAVAAVANGRLLVDDLRALRAEWVDRIRARSDSAVWPLVDLVLRQTVVTTALVQSELGVNHGNAMRAISRLAEAGVLSETGGRRRSILWQADAVLSALDAFAARAGRRGYGER